LERQVMDLNIIKGHRKAALFLDGDINTDLVDRILGSGRKVLVRKKPKRESR